MEADSSGVRSEERPSRVQESKVQPLESNAKDKISETRYSKVSGVQFLKDVKEHVFEFLAAVRSVIAMFVYIDTLESYSVVIMCIFLAWQLGRMQCRILAAVVISILAVDSLARIHRKQRTIHESRIREKYTTERLYLDSESAEWLNMVVKRVWIGVEPGISDAIKTSINDVLTLYKPSFLDDLRLKVLTLGSRAIRILQVRSYPSSSDSSMSLTCEVEFTPHTDESRVYRDAKRFKLHSVGSRIELVARVGRGPASIPVPILVTNLQLKGILNIYLDTITSYPYIKTLVLSFEDVPYVNFDLKPLKMIDIMDIFLLSNILQETVKSQFSANIVEPNRITVDLEEILVGTSGPDKDIILGVLVVSLVEGIDIKSTDFAGKSDPYAIVTISEVTVAKTKIISNTTQPFWDECFYIPITHSMIIGASANCGDFQINVYDYNSVNKDKLIGSTKVLNLAHWISLTGILNNFPKLALKVPEVSESKARKLINEWGAPISPHLGPVEVKQKLYSRYLGELESLGEVALTLNFIPVTSTIEKKGTLSETDKKNAALEIDKRNTMPQYYVVKVQILDSSGFNAGNRDLTTIVTCFDDRKIHECTSIREGKNPQWNSEFYTYFDDSKPSALNFSFLVGDKAVGSISIGIANIISGEREEHVFNLNRTDQQSQSKVRIEFYATLLDKSYIPQNSYTEACAEGLIRLTVVEARNLPRMDFVGKSDPYVKVYFGNKYFGATHVKENTMNPEWSEVFHAICYDKNNSLKLYVWDSNNIKKDREIGLIACPLRSITERNSLKAEFSAEAESGILNNFPSVEKPLSSMSEVISNLDLEKCSSPQLGHSESRGSYRLGQMKVSILPDGQCDVWARLTPFKVNTQFSSEGNFSNDDIFDSRRNSIVSRGQSSRVDELKSSIVENVGISMDMLGMKRAKSDNVNSNDKIKSIGFLHFNLSFFDVEKGMVITAKPESFYQPILAPVADVLEDNLKKEVLKNNFQMETADSEKHSEKTISKQESFPSLRDASSNSMEVITGVEPSKSMQKLLYVLNNYKSGIITFIVHSVELYRKPKNKIELMYLELVRGHSTFWRSRAVSYKQSVTFNQPVSRYTTLTMDFPYKLVVKVTQDRTPHDTDLVVGECNFLLDEKLIGRAMATLVIEYVRGEKSSTKGLSEEDILGEAKISVSYAPLNPNIIFDANDDPGVLYCDIVSVSNLEAINSDGNSDPYVVVQMNGKRIFKTKTINNCLNPIWNKCFSVSVSNKLRTTLEFQVKDFNKIMKNRIIGTVTINLAATLPTGFIVIKEFCLDGARNGYLLLRLLFLPKGMYENENFSAVNPNDKGDVLNIVDKQTSSMMKIKNVIGQGLTTGSAKVEKIVDKISTFHRSFESNKNTEDGSFNLLTLAAEFSMPIMRINKNGVITSRDNGEDVRCTDTPILMQAPYREKEPYSGKVFVKILDGTNLIKDEDNKSALYVKFKQLIHGREKSFYKTPILRKMNRESLWDNEAACVTIPPTKLRIVVMNRNNLNKDTTVGELFLDLAMVYSKLNENEIECTEWYPLTVSNCFGSIKMCISYPENQSKGTK